MITFDDGYANNILAAEILSRYRIPWIVHISTGAMGHENAIWAVALSLLLLHGEADKVDVLGKEWTLHNRAERETAFAGIRVPMKGMPAALRSKTMNEICSQFPLEETRRLLGLFPSLQMLSWTEIDQLSASGAEIGSHGVFHEIHHAHQDTEVRLSEMADSMKELERILHRPCKSFAYPNGDTVPSSPGEARTTGYKLAFAAIEKTVIVGTDPYLIPRLKPRTRLEHMAEDLFWEK
jgi:peptidoglycan/xylan/chitin deacetylase (PgdA/CDA1 family)